MPALLDVETFRGNIPSQRLLSANACTSNAHHGNHPTFVVEIRHDDLETLVLSSNQVPWRCKALDAKSAKLCYFD